MSLRRLSPLHKCFATSSEICVFRVFRMKGDKELYSSIGTKEVTNSHWTCGDDVLLWVHSSSVLMHL